MKRNEGLVVEVTKFNELSRDRRFVLKFVVNTKKNLINLKALSLINIF